MPKSKKPENVNLQGRPSPAECREICGKTDDKSNDGSFGQGKRKMCGPVKVLPPLQKKNW